MKKVVGHAPTQPCPVSRAGGFRCSSVPSWTLCRWPNWSGAVGLSEVLKQPQYEPLSSAERQSSDPLSRAPKWLPRRRRRSRRSDFERALHERARALRVRRGDRGTARSRARPGARRRRSERSSGDQLAWRSPQLTAVRGVQPRQFGATRGTEAALHRCQAPNSGRAIRRRIRSVEVHRKKITKAMELVRRVAACVAPRIARIAGARPYARADARRAGAARRLAEARGGGDADSLHPLLEPAGRDPMHFAFFVVTCGQGVVPAPQRDGHEARRRRLALSRRRTSIVSRS